jgi:hypothetical protein
MKKKYEPISLIIIVFVIIVATVLLIKETPKVDTGDKKPTGGIVAQKAYHCGMTVDSPIPSASVSFPLTVTATVHNAAATDGCRWTLFEGQAGTVALNDQAGNTLMLLPFMTTSGDWMTDAPVQFSATIAPATAIPSGTPLTLVFTEEDPSGMNTPDTISVSVTAQ